MSISVEAQIALQDETIAQIVFAVAIGIICTDCEDGYSCPHCSAVSPYCATRKDVPELDELVHDADCPVVIARQLLVSNGTPLNIYKMESTSGSGHTLAISEEEAMRNWGNWPTIKATFVRVFPMEVAQS